VLLEALPSLHSFIATNVGEYAEHTPTKRDKSIAKGHQSRQCCWSLAVATLWTLTNFDPPDRSKHVSKPSEVSFGVNTPVKSAVRGVAVPSKRDKIVPKWSLLGTKEVLVELTIYTLSNVDTPERLKRFWKSSEVYFWSNSQEA